MPVYFNLTDPKQKAAYDILKNAGYGKRTPTIVDALLNSKQGVPESVGYVQGISAAELRIVVEEDIVVKKPSRAHKSEPSPPPRQPKPLERPISKQMPEPDEPAASDGNMDVLLYMADAFY